jgi:uncharacterized membrane protein
MANYRLFSNSYYKIRMGMMVFITFINCIALASALGHLSSNLPIIQSFAMLLLAFLGNYMATLKPNWFIGFRTPWTLEYEKVWRKTHRFGAKIWVAGGITGAFLPFVLGTSYAGYSMGSLVALLALAPAIYSFALYRSLKRNGELDGNSIETD